MVILGPMANRIAPASPELTKFYSERHAWRNSGEERMRFRKHMRLAQERPGSALLDIGSRNRELPHLPPRDVKHQQFNIPPMLCRPRHPNHEILPRPPLPENPVDYAFLGQRL